MPDLVEWSLDLAAHEQTRVAAVLSAVGDQLDLVDMYYGECDAHRLFYTGLSPEQRAVYQQLIDVGIFDPQGT